MQLLRDVKKAGVKCIIFSLFIALILSSQVLNSSAKEDTIEFEQSTLIFEVNTTAKDIGVQLKLDGEPWSQVMLFNPNGKLLATIKGKGGLNDLGLTENFFETNEPVYQGPDADTTVEEFLDMFPEGEYILKGRTAEGGKIEGTAELSHILPCGPVVSVVDTDPLNTVIAWDPVTHKIDPDTGDCEDAPSPEDINIVGYEVIVEVEDPLLRVFDVFLPGSATSVMVSPDFLTSGTDYFFEVIAIQGNDGEYGNQSITEGSFTTD